MDEKPNSDTHVNQLFIGGGTKVPLAIVLKRKKTAAQSGAFLAYFLEFQFYAICESFKAIGRNIIELYLFCDVTMR